ncbi:MAG TPA: universal stress protein [Gaiellaceae bacterium]|nr:universal stress protein [Gaiellaceae bacterium]
MAAVDNSAAARPVLAAGKEIAVLFGAALEAVHVREDGGRTAAAEADAAGVPLRTIESESVAGGLIEEGRSPAVVALVMGARGARTGRRPAGHVALELIVSTSKPVVVVPPTARAPWRLERILVPLDATLATTSALARTIELARRAEIEVVALHVHDERSLPPFTDQPQHELEAWRHEFLARYCPHGEGARLDVRVGSPGEHVLDVAAAEDVSLIALGWAQDLGRGHAVVVQEVLGRSAVPVLLVPLAAAR